MIPFKEWQEDTNTASVVGTGDDNSVVMRKKYDKKNKRKDQFAVLKRLTDIINKKKG